MNAILSVGALTEALRKNLEEKFPFVWVRGEVTNFSVSGAGHIYFSLKDESAQLQCVWFRSRQGMAAASRNFDPLTGEVYEKARPAPMEFMRNGLDMLCAGGISVYAGRGQYQLVVEIVMPAGEGFLAQEFEARKARLAEAGYFSQARKRPLPLYPVRVALVASPSGAAIHDFLELAGDRGLAATIRIFPVPAQGEGAAEKIAAAMELANAQNWAQVIVMIRGGGSLEDLWAFNEEVLARAVFSSRLPVLAGIGHEIDVTLADMTADVRAATPSHAAQLLWPPRRELRQRLDELDSNLSRRMAARLEDSANELARRTRALGWLSPCRKLERLRTRHEESHKALRRQAASWLALKFHKWLSLEAARKNSAFRPEKINVAQERLRWFSRTLRERVAALCAREEAGRALMERRLDMAVRKRLEERRARLRVLEIALSGLDPLAPLQRGYALLYGAKGLARSISDVETGQKLSARLADGVLDVRVENSRGLQK